jgi:23S rRNA (cytidine1920-2'-O)/16S rRNA (cytidine1409-2'-O)-methyltransferase
MPPKIRLDQLLFDQGLAESREQAKRLVMAGRVYITDKGREERADKPGRQVAEDAAIRLAGGERFVSRGAYKLLTALEEFDVDPTGKICLDVGASTGGFTDCLLQHGALKVYAADVGYGLLDAKLREDERVVVLERTNMRTAPPELLPEKVDLLTADVSFISLTKVLPACMAFLKEDAELVTLCKPQFEVGPGGTVKGVVKDEKKRRQAVDMVTDFIVRELGLNFVGEAPSKIKGPKGNQEYLLYFRREA